MQHHSPEIRLVPLALQQRLHSHAVLLKRQFSTQEIQMKIPPLQLFPEGSHASLQLINHRRLSDKIKSTYTFEGTDNWGNKKKFPSKGMNLEIRNRDNLISKLRWNRKRGKLSYGKICSRIKVYDLYFGNIVVINLIANLCIYMKYF